ncbi:hypothetical protein BSKO_09950 [Bryopsis sp. KO-2023]|nr:hypothetical protein BSKO_09950 [Bryopsis sp. KO-2023]
MASKEEMVNADERAQSVELFTKLGVCPELAEMAVDMGWKKPMRIQEESIPLILQNRDVIGLAQTGSGKTGAFALPILQSLLDKPQAFYALVLSPTRELALQISEQFETLGQGISAKCAALVGGVDKMAQAVALGRGPHVIVGTPGRVVDHLTNTKGFSLSKLKHLVLDEADKLLDMDFEEDIDQILKVIPRARRTQLFSATMTNKVQKLQRACLRDPVKVEVASKYSTVETLRQQYLFVPAKHKDCYLAFAVNELNGSAFIIFTRTCEASRRVALVLRNLGFGAVPIHGQMTQVKRIAALNKFKSGERGILVATDVASRGLDIPSVDVVINYDVPPNPKDYVHRVGRTARAGRSGRAVTIVTQYDVEMFQRIEFLTGQKMEEFPHQKDEVLLLLERINESQRLAAAQLREGGEGSKEAHRKGKRKGALDDVDDAELIMQSVLKRKKKSKG